MLIRPLNDDIIVEHLPLQEKTDSGIFLIQHAGTEDKQMAKVIFVGNKQNDIKEGDTIICDRLSGNKIKIGDKMLYRLTAKQVQAIVDGDYTQNTIATDKNKTAMISKERAQQYIPEAMQ